MQLYQDNRPCSCRPFRLPFWLSLAVLPSLRRVVYEPAAPSFSSVNNTTLMVELGSALLTAEG